MLKKQSTSSANRFVNQSLESSNKLDDLLKRCREIGSNDKSSATATTSKTISNSIKPLNEIRITKFKLVKTAKVINNLMLTQKKQIISYETKRLLAARRKKYLQTQFRLKNSVLTKSPKTKILFFSLANNNTKSGIYKKVNNNIKTETSNNKLNKRFKLVNTVNSSQTSSYLKSKNNFIIKKYRILTATKLINKPNEIKKLTTTSSKSSAAFKLNNTNKQQYCLFYNRFGRCSRGDSCKLIHDSKRIALCPRLVFVIFIYFFFVECKAIVEY